MSNFRNFDRGTAFLLPPPVDDWLPEKHLARFIVEVIDGLNLSAMSGVYRGSGSASYHPRLLLALLVYGYATGVFSSRKLERATYDSVAFRFIAANEHPDHGTIATFRRRFLKEIEALFVQVLLLAREMGLLKMGTVALGGTKIHANASRHSALSYEYAGKLEAQLKAEVAELMAKAEAAGKADVPDGMSIPDELARREERLKKLAEARAKACPREGGDRSACQGAIRAGASRVSSQTGGTRGQDKDHRQEARRQAARAAGGRPAANRSDQSNGRRVAHHAGCWRRLRTMLQRASRCGGRQSAGVAQDVVQAPNDKQQLEPMLAKTSALPEELGKAETLLGDNGYFSEANVKACEAAKIEPLIAMGRDQHHPSLQERFAEAPPAPENPAPVQAMAHRLQTPEGKKLYALRKHTPEPVFGIIKSVLGFRQFLLRGLENVRGEWSLVTMAWNIKRMFALKAA
jgi:transposase